MRSKPILIFTCVMLAGNFVFGQFVDKGRSTVTTCDCNTQFNELYFQLPPLSTSGYDLIGITVQSARKGIYLAKRIYSSGEFSSKNGTILNLLNPDEMGGQTFMGVELGLYQGNDLNLSYSKLCEKNYEFDVVFTVVGIKQVGTETTYSVEGNVLKANTKKLYDDGTVLLTSDPMHVIPGKVKNRDMAAMVAAVALIPMSRIVGGLVQMGLVAITD
jgi:hypothetical protein